MELAPFPGTMAGTACPRCGGFVPAAASYCGHCGAPALRPATPGGAPAGAPAPRRSRGPWLVVGIVAAAVVATVVLVIALVGLLSPTQYGWQSTFEVRPATPTYEYPPEIPGGDSVHGSWTAIGTGWVNLTIANGGLVSYSGNGTVGSFSFLSDGLAYTVEAVGETYENVTIELSYSSLAPLL